MQKKRILLEMRVRRKGKTMIRKELIPEEYYSGCETCSECTMKQRKNTPEEYAQKVKDMHLLRQKIGAAPFREGSYREIMQKEELDYETLLGEDGRFADLSDDVPGTQTAIQRLALMGSDYHKSQNRAWPTGLKARVLKGAAHYCRLEADRTDLGGSRFHASIFMFPSCALNLFFDLQEDMETFEAYEEGNTEVSFDVPVELVEDAYRQLLRIAVQTFTLPQRGDHTDRHPISIERFRKHVWWVGGNAIAYRPVFYAAIALQSVELMDVMETVLHGCLTPVSAVTLDEAFWSEGICADGFGWGHGRQSYNTGYAYDGSINALKMLDILKGTAWERKESIDFFWLFNYIHGLSYITFRGEWVPMQTRHAFKHRHVHTPGAEKCIRDLANALHDHFSAHMTAEQREEVNRILQTKYIDEMERYGEEYGSDYHGIRYFFNNDALIAKQNNRYLYVNMASARTDGVEFADGMADKRNYFMGDGSYMLMKKGMEYDVARGTWQVSHIPGVTERDLKNSEMATETNWTGYHSRYNFAAGVCREEGGACGFLFEKDDSRQADGSGVVRRDYTKEMMGIFAAKSYFVLGDTIVCLGAGITDKHPEYGHAIITTVNNTLCESEPVRVLCEENADMDYIAQGGVLYGVRRLPGNRLMVQAEDRKTHWTDLNGANTDVKDEMVPIFELRISHGEAPVQASYEYYMYCGGEDPRAYIQDREPVVLANSTKVQAVSDHDGTCIAAVCYEANAAADSKGIYLTMDYPGAVMLQKTEDGVYVTVCDGIQLEERREIKVSYRLPGDAQTHEVTITLPEKELTGKPVTRLVTAV